MTKHTIVFKAAAILFSIFESSVMAQYTTPNTAFAVITNLDAIAGSGLAVVSNQLTVVGSSGSTFRVAGPFSLNNKADILFQNTGWTNGVTTNSDFSAFGFTDTTVDSSFTINPVRAFGSNVSYSILALNRIDSIISNGIYFALQQISSDGTTNGISGLTGVHLNTNYTAYTSSSRSTGTDQNYFFYLKPWFAAQNGGNGATIQDTTIYFIGQ